MYRLLKLIFPALLLPLVTSAQIWTTYPGDNACGTITPQVFYCPGSSNSFCVGDSVGFGSNSVGNVDSSWIDWGDNSLTVYPSNFSCVYKRYNFKPDSCVPNGYLKLYIILGFYDTCAAGYSLNSFITSIFVKFRPHAEFSLTPAIVCTDEPINFNLIKTCSNANTVVNEYVHYTWNMGNGTIINDSTNGPILPPPAPNDRYTVSGNYVITLSIKNNCDSVAYTRAIKVLPPTTIAPGITADSCAPASFQPVMIASNVLTYLWTSNPAAAFNSDTIATPLINITNPGAYIFNVNATGCCFPPQSICTWADTLQFDQRPWVTPQIVQPTLCDSGDINPNSFFIINDPDNIILSYQWSFPGGTPANDLTASPPLIHYPATGVYPLSLIITSACGNDTIIDSVHVYRSPVLNITSSPLTDCDTITLTFNNTSIVTQNYLWSVPSPGVFIAPTGSSSASPLISYNVPNNYAVVVTAFTNAVCPTVSDTFNVNLLPGPKVQLTSFIPDSCISATLNPLNFFNISGLIGNYSWVFTGGNPATDTTATPPLIVYDTTGYFGVTLIASNNTCGADSVTDSFFVSLPPVLNVTPDSLLGCGNLTVNFTNISPAGQSYNWTAPNGTFTIGSNTSPSPGIYYSIPGTDLITVYATTPGCPASPSQNFSVTVGEAPELVTTALLPIPDGCDSTFTLHWLDYFILTTHPSDSGYSWEVLLNNISIYNDASPNPPDFNGTQTGEYIVIASVWNNCDTIVLSDTFNVFTPATLYLSQDTIVCKDGGSYHLNINPTGGSWYQNGSLTPMTIPDFDPYTALTDSNKFVYIYAAGTNCETSDSFLVIVSGLNVSAGSDIKLCTNLGTIILNGGTPVNGSWAGSVINNPTSTGSYDPGLTTGSVDTLIYTYANSVTSCSTNDTMIVTLNVPVVALFTLTDTVCIGDVVLFDNLSINTGALWNFGDATSTDTNNITTHIYNSDNIYLTTLITTDQNGCKDTIMDSITVFRAPDATFTPDTSALCAGLPLHITNTSSLTPYTTYIWNYGNGIIDSTFIPDTAYYNQALGSSVIYNIILQAINKCGSVSDTHAILVNQVPFASAGYSQGDGCSPDTVEFSNISLGGGGQYVWYINNIQVSTDSALLTQVFTTGSNVAMYYFTLTATNGCGTDSFSDSIRINPSSVSAFFNMSNNAVCKYDTLRFISYSTPGSYIFWDFGDGSTANGDTVDYAYSQPGIFTVTQIAFQCGTDTARDLITINELPQASFTVPRVSCSVDTLLFTNTSFSPGQIGSTWDFGDANTSTFTSPTHHYSDSGIYNVTLNVTEAITGCKDSSQQTIYIVANPLASFYIPNLEGCTHTISIVNNSTGADHYLWDMGNGDVVTDPQPVYTYPDTGRFTVTLLASSNNLCTDDTAFSYVYILPVPKAVFTPDPYHRSILSPYFRFQNFSTGDSIIAYTWKFGDGTSAYSFEPTHYYADTGFYNVQLIVTNANNCEDSTYHTIEVAPEFVFYVPSSFTPDGDGRNDFFNVKGWFIDHARLIIFNRWGEKLFETDDYETGWNGRNRNDHKAEGGVYVYIIKAVDPDGIEYKKKGYFTLLR